MADDGMLKEAGDRLLADWQQQELLQMVVWNLDKKELYFLSVLLMVCVKLQELIKIDAGFHRIGSIETT